MTELIEPEGAPTYHAPALDKGLDILECLSRSRVPLSQAQLARALERRPGEIFRMLTTLERRGYIRRDPNSGAYELTLRLFELGQSHAPYEEIVRAARWPMRDLTIAIHQGCHLCVLRGGDALVLAQEPGPTRVRLSVEVGSTIPMLESASGRLLLASLSVDVRTDTLTRETDYTDRPPAERAAIDERLAAIHRQGFETVRDEQTAGVSDIAVPVGSPASRTQVALAVAALHRDHEMFVRETLDVVRTTARLITSLAGLTDGSSAE